MNALGTYDTELQMFVEPKRELDVEKLRFLRWLAEQGRLEHATAGASRSIGPPASQPSATEIELGPDRE